MTGKRRVFCAAVKAKVAWAAVRGTRRRRNWPQSTKGTPARCAKTRISKAGIEEIVSNGFDSIALEIRFSMLDVIQSPLPLTHQVFDRAQWRQR